MLMCSLIGLKERCLLILHLFAVFPGHWGIEKYPPPPAKWKHMQESNHQAALLLLQIMCLGIRQQVFSRKDKEGMRRVRRREPVKKKCCMEKTMKGSHWPGPQGQDEMKYPKAAVCQGIHQAQDRNTTSLAFMFRLHEHKWFTQMHLKPSTTSFS